MTAISILSAVGCAQAVPSPGGTAFEDDQVSAAGDLPGVHAPAIEAFDHSPSLVGGRLTSPCYTYEIIDDPSLVLRPQSVGCFTVINASHGDNMTAVTVMAQTGEISDDVVMDGIHAMEPEKYSVERRDVGAVPSWHIQATDSWGLGHSFVIVPVRPGVMEQDGVPVTSILITASGALSRDSFERVVETFALSDALIPQAARSS